MGKHKGSRKPYLGKRDSLKKHFSAKEKKWGVLNLCVLVIMALAASFFVFYPMWP